MELSFYIIFATGLVAVIYSTIQYVRDWRGGKRRHTLESIDKRLTTIEEKIGIFNNEGQDKIGNVNRNIKTQLEKIKKHNSDK